MEENKRNEEQSSDSSTRQDQNREQVNQTETTAGQRMQDQNPQQGSQWNNYQTRELGEKGGEGNATTSRSE